MGAVLAAMLMGAHLVSAQGPNDHDLPVLPDLPVLSMRGTGELHADGIHLVHSGGTEGYITAHDRLLVNDDDGRFEIRAHLIGEDGTDPTLHVHEVGGEVIYNYSLLVSCPHADVCRLVTDVYVEFEGGGEWEVALEYGSARCMSGSWRCTARAQRWAIWICRRSRYRRCWPCAATAR